MGGGQRRQAYGSARYALAVATLPLVLAVVLLEIAIGGAFLLWLLDRSGQAPSGFVKLTAGVDAAAVAFAMLLVPALSAPALARDGLDTAAIGAFGQALAIVMALVLAHFIVAFLPWPQVRNVVGIVVVVAGGLTLAVAAIARPSTSPYDIFALLALPLGALAVGGASAAMLLGHWYLVTPKLTTDPLRLAAMIVAAAVVLQSAIVAVSFARGEFSGTLETALWVAVALRIGVGLAMTFGVALAAWWTARMNTQSATGLLYVGLGTAIAGELSARMLFFLLGIAV